MTEIYAIVFKDTNEIVTPDSFCEYWERYGLNDLQGWGPPKKLYYTLGRAKSGFSHMPSEIKEKTAIARFVFGEIVEDGAELKEKQDRARLKKEEAKEKEQAKYRLERAERDFKKAQEELERLKKDA